MVTNKLEDSVFSALADGTRREILMSLADEPLPVKKIASHFNVSRPAISKHLRILKEASLVGIDRKGRSNLYYLRSNTLREVENWLTLVWGERLSKLKLLVEESEDDQ